MSRRFMVLCSLGATLLASATACQGDDSKGIRVDGDGEDNATGPAICQEICADGSDCFVGGSDVGALCTDGRCRQPQDACVNDGECMGSQLGDVCDAAATHCSCTGVSSCTSSQFDGTSHDCVGI